MRIAMIGTGYVGLVTGACLADFGHRVVCVDKDPAKVAALRVGRMPIYEPGLEELVARNVREGRLSFDEDLGPAVAEAAAVFVAVGTPSRRGDGHADLTYVYQAVREIAAAVRGHTVVVAKSTLPVGTGDRIERILRETRADIDVSVASNPEFLREGAAIDDFKRPNRIVVGVEDERAKSVMAEVYRPLHINQGPLVFTSRRTAELIKYASNAFLATKITLINELADLCEATGADVQEVARGVGLDHRIGSKFLHAGPGFGGSCFPKDMLALMRMGQEHGAPMRLVEQVVNVNEARKSSMVRRISAALDEDLAGRTVAILGLTFKPNTDDMRESPAIPLVNGLIDRGARVKAYDPAGMAEARSVLPQIDYAASAYDCVDGADCAVFVTEWNEFRALDLDRLKALLARPVVVDLRNIYAPDEMAARGFRYDSVGRHAKSGVESRRLGEVQQLRYVS